jgi:hypothetical protein
VDDQKAKVAELEAADVPHVRENPDAPLGSLARTALNEKFFGPDRVHFDVCDRGWNEAIRCATLRTKAAGV